MQKEKSDFREEHNRQVKLRQQRIIYQEDNNRDLQIERVCYFGIFSL